MLLELDFYLNRNEPNWNENFDEKATQQKHCSILFLNDRKKLILRVIIYLYYFF